MREHHNYYQTGPLAFAYESHFKGKGPEAKYAFISLGKSFEETRFYFADAAITRLSQDWKQDLGGNFFDEFSRYLRATHIAIRSIIRGYLKSRAIKLIDIEEE